MDALTKHRPSVRAQDFYSVIAFVAFLKSAWGILKLIPWQVYAVIAGGIAIYGYGLNEHHLGFKEAKAEDAKAEEVKRKAQEASNALANAQLFSVGFDAKKRADFAEWKLQDEAKDHAVKLAAAQSKEKNYEPAIVLAAVPQLPVGYILWRLDTAGFANGIDIPDAPAAPKESLGQPSGLSLTEISDLDLAQASAFREAVTWGKSWQQRARDVEQECTAIISTVKGSS